MWKMSCGLEEGEEDVEDQARSSKSTDGSKIKGNLRDENKYIINIMILTRNTMNGRSDLAKKNVRKNCFHGQYLAHP